MFVDSHCHLDRLNLDKYQDDLSAALNAARTVSVEHMLCVCINLENFSDVLSIAENNDDVTASVGVHPSETEGKNPTVSELTELAQHKKIVAIGETGLDYHYNQGDLEWQRQRFRTHIQAACEVNKPLIIHTRDAKEHTIQIMREENAQDATGVMHCFTEDWTMAKQALDLGFYISFSGIVTFKNAIELKEVAKKVPLDRMLIETDSPYLAPVPNRGKPNEPAYVVHVAEHISQLRDESVEKIAEQTTSNFYQLFRAPH